MPCRARPLLTLLTVVAMLAGFPALAPQPAAAVGTADLAVTMVGDAKHLKFGQTITFTVTVSNNGPDAGTAEVGMGFSDSYAVFGGTCPDGSVSTICSLGTLAPNASVTLEFTAMASNSCCPIRLGVAVASVHHDANTVDPVSANDSVRLETKFVGKAPF